MIPRLRFLSSLPVLLQLLILTAAPLGAQEPPVVRGELGRLEVESVRETTVALEVVVRGERGERATLSFSVEPVPPFRLRGLQVEVGGG